MSSSQVFAVFVTVCVAVLHAAVLASNDGHQQPQVVVRPYHFGLLQQQQQQQQAEANLQQTVHGVAADYFADAGSNPSVAYAVSSADQNPSVEGLQPHVVQYVSQQQLNEFANKAALDNQQQLQQQEGDRPLAEFERAGYGYRRRKHHKGHQHEGYMHHRPQLQPIIMYQPAPSPAPTYKPPEPQQQKVPAVYVVPLYQPVASYPAPAPRPQQTYHHPPPPPPPPPPPKPVYHPPPQPAPQPTYIAQPVTIYRPAPPQPVYVGHSHYHVHEVPQYPVIEQPGYGYDVDACPAVADNFCYGKEAGHYTHPGSSQCFVQCDHVGRAFAKECAYGTSWRGYGSEAAYANMCA